MSNVIQLGGTRPPKPPAAEPKGPRPIGVRMPGLITTGHLEEHFVKDRYGDDWAPITYITVEGRCLLLMNCSDGPDGPAANDQE